MYLLALESVIDTALKQIKTKEDLIPYQDKFVVYLIVFPNNKAYCGYSSNIKRRWSRNYYEYKSSKALYAALQKYAGQEKKYIIATFDTPQEALEFEKYMIEALGLLDNSRGYNLVPGGGDPPHGLQHITPEGYKKMQENGARLAREMAALPDQKKQEIFKKMSESALRARASLSEEERKEKYGKQNKGKAAINAKPIYQLDKITEAIIGEYPSAKQAGIALGDAEYRKNISAVANGRKKTAYNFKWRWK